jgi:hypothetical protein
MVRRSHQQPDAAGGPELAPAPPPDVAVGNHRRRSAANNAAAGAGVVSYSPPPTHPAHRRAPRAARRELMGKARAVRLNHAHPPGPTPPTTPRPTRPTHPPTDSRRTTLDRVIASPVPAQAHNVDQLLQVQRCRADRPENDDGAVAGRVSAAPSAIRSTSPLSEPATGPRATPPAQDRTDELAARAANRELMTRLNSPVGRSLQ